MLGQPGSTHSRPLFHIKGTYSAAVQQNSGAIARISKVLTVLLPKKTENAPASESRPMIKLHVEGSESHMSVTLHSLYHAEELGHG